jgi:catechol 2,3-dioxygenase-like lactoylglutathione lyase family enzyme
MGVEFGKPGIDIGIVTGQGDAMLAFYRDVVGLEPEYTVELPGGGVMHRLLAGSSIFKIMCPDVAPKVGVRSTAPSEPTQTIPDLVGETNKVRGFRFITIWVPDIDEAYRKSVDGGAAVVYPSLDARPGVRVAVVEDPDGNWIEFVQMVDLQAAEDDLHMKHDKLASSAS